jgi:hypothetical protein
MLFDTDSHYHPGCPDLLSLQPSHNALKPSVALYWSLRQAHWFHPTAFRVASLRDRGTHKVLARLLLPYSDDAHDLKSQARCFLALESCSMTLEQLSKGQRELAPCL